MEHVNAAYESIVGSPRQYERKTYLDGLQEAKRSVTKQEKALTVTHTMPFNKYKVFYSEDGAASHLNPPQSRRKYSSVWGG